MRYVLEAPQAPLALGGRSCHRKDPRKSTSGTGRLSRQDLGSAGPWVAPVVGPEVLRRGNPDRCIPHHCRQLKRPVGTYSQPSGPPLSILSHFLPPLRAQAGWVCTQLACPPPRPWPENSTWAWLFQIATAFTRNRRCDSSISSRHRAPELLPFRTTTLQVMPAAITPPPAFVPLGSTKLFTPIQIGPCALSHRIIQVGGGQHPVTVASRLTHDTRRR